MNRIHRLVWNELQRAWLAVAENTPSGGKRDAVATTLLATLVATTLSVGYALAVSVQPGASSVTLNRVNDANPSQIFGRINANGQVFLSNPNGVYFAPGAPVDVGGLVATTHRIGLDNFMAGRIRFERDGGTGSAVTC